MKHNLSLKELFFCLIINGIGLWYSYIIDSYDYIYSGFCYHLNHQFPSLLSPMCNNIAFALTVLHYGFKVIVLTIMCVCYMRYGGDNQNENTDE